MMLDATPREDFFGTSGPRDAELAIVGESWGREEEQRQQPFVGASGAELDRMLFESGLSLIPTLKTNLFAYRPEGDEAWRLFNPKGKDKNPLLKGLDPSPFALNEYHRLFRQLSQMPNLKCVIATGNYALWALSDALVSISGTSMGNGATVLVPGGITSWRGSMLHWNSPSSRAIPLLPIIHPAAILRAWYQRAATIQDLRRAHQAFSGDWAPKTAPKILAPPEFNQAIQKFEEWLALANSGARLRLAHDIETKHGLITCMGFATGPYDETGFAMVIPLVRLKPGRQFDSFWTQQQEAHLAHLIRKILSHPNVHIEGQNYTYDTQYIQRFYGCIPSCSFDTMLAHHLLFPGTPKSLDYLSSLYCRYHRYWKDDNKDWDLSSDEKQHLVYNGVDVLRTFECATRLRTLITELKQEEQWEWEKKKADLALRMMFRGVRIDLERRADIGTKLLMHQLYLRGRLSTLIAPQLVPVMKSPTAKPWYQSTRQQAPIIYDVLGLKGQRNRKTGNITVDDEALAELARLYPELKTFFDLLLESRSIQVFHSTFVKAPLEPSGRMRCSFNPAGTETFRWSSSENAFGRGTNLQNVPKGEED